jgi:hypothetical protein
MNTSLDASQEDSRAAIRLAAYWLLVVTAAGAMGGRILNVKSEKGDSPFLSANDRSRWCAVRALVDEGRYEIDNVIEDRHAKTKRRHWYTIDMVRHRGRDGKQHAYSSKPPLFPTLLAGQYWLIQRAIGGATLSDEPFYIARCMLVITNVAPLLLYFLLLARLVERYGTTDWGKMFVVAAAAWGTFLTTFAVTLNNHLPAAVSALIAVYAALPVWTEGERRWRFFAAAGLFAAFTAANELPALSLFAALGGALFLVSPVRTLGAFVPAAAVVAVAFFGVNILAHDDWRPPYAHRGDGALLAELDPSLASGMADGPVSDKLRESLAHEEIEVSAETVVAVRRPAERWEIWDPQQERRWAVVRSDQRLNVHAWDNWYDYEGSYWRPENKKGVDRGEPRSSVYAFHVILGHHGVFSLTPIWLMSVVGAGLILGGVHREYRQSPGGPAGARTALMRRGLGMAAVVTAACTIVCLAFYLARPLADRNYGGVSCGFRWMFWFTPLWLLCLLPAADAAASRRSWRVVALVLLFISVVSANYAASNPWSHPWMYDYLQYLGWVRQ